MLEKYLNREVIVEEKNYQLPSSIHIKGMTGTATHNEIEGLLTAFDNDFIELDNNSIINRKHIYRIILK